MDVHIGSSGFAYEFWKGSFYPPDIKSDAMLAFYGERLNAVEINNTFYRIPKKEVVRKWGEAVPPAFRFVIKASRRITHMARLKDCQESVDYMFDNLEPLGDRLGAVLFQCPPYLKKNVDRLQAFVQMLPAGVRSAIEFRHQSWFCEPVYDVLRTAGVSLCTGDYEGGDADAPPVDPTITSTTDWGYLRLRDESYDEHRLRRIVELTTAQAWSTAFVFFKHEPTAPMLCEHMTRLVAAVQGD